MTTTIRTPPVYKSDSDVLEVCAWCWPNRSLFLFFPELERLKLRTTHGMCPKCNYRQMVTLINSGIVRPEDVSSAVR